MAKESFLDKILIATFRGVNALIPWHKLPTFLGVANLLAYRVELEAKNLYDVYPDAGYQGTKATCPMKDSRYLSARNSDGLFNDLEQPMMGCVGMRFGRNVSRDHTTKPTDEELLTPSPRLVSEKLLARSEFKPATIVNLLAAAWIQFQVHDWVFHEEYAPGENDVEIPLPEGDKWPSGHMKIMRTKPDITLDETDKKSPGYRNTNTAWWDGSQVYGESEIATSALRDGAVNGKLKMTKEGMENFLPRDENNLPKTGFNLNWWLGLELLHTLFALEHNHICDLLHENNPEWSSDQLFDTARLVNCALMAKIHTTEWTPAILDHPTINSALHANWWGIIGEKLHKLLGRISKNDVIGGIPGSGVNQAGVPYTLTEEFVSVYRLHPLIPDNIAFFDTASGAHVKTTPIIDLAFSKAQEAFDSKTTMGDTFYSFGINFPGAITHNNTPSFLRNLVTPDGVLRDIASVDILRDRERGVPRYCEFRRLFHMKAPKTFLELVGGKDKALATTLSEVYENDIEKVDLQVGMFCEPLPKGFGFSDTAFRVFILMASRRIQSDRFLAGDGWSEDVYSKEGMAHVQNETMISILLRHFPELKPALLGKDNAFRPWTKVGSSAEYKGVETTAPA
ncbi:heme peroxidase [Acephala macrosclerotiorum]|nr:heme peroxidase [Acephala macrosclerotiorum]